MHLTAHSRAALACAAALSAGLMGGTAASAAGVGTYVNNYSGLSGNRNFEGYNFTTDSQFNIFYSGGGVSTYTACATACSTSGSGTADHVGNATSSFNTAGMSDVDQGGPSSGSGYARANLATGELGASVDGTYRSAFGQGSGIGTRAFATFGDTLLFTVLGADASTETDITLNFIVHGDMSRVNAFTNGSVDAYLNFGGPIFNGNIQINSETNAPYVYSSGASYWKSSSVTALADGIAFSGVYGLRGASSAIDLGAYLSVSCGNGVTCDYNNTAAVSFVLPETVKFTSASGVFLTQPGEDAIPEPSAWVMMLSGFGAIGGLLRRRRAVASTIARPISA